VFLTLITELIRDVMDYRALHPVAKPMAQSVKYACLIYVAVSVIMRKMSLADPPPPPG